MRTKEQLEKEIKKLQDELEALPKVTLKAGDLCEFWDDEQPQDVSNHISYFKEHLSSAVCDVDDVTYDHARKLETKATRIEWNGGDCPVYSEEIVAVERAEMGFRIGKAEKFDWSYDGDELKAQWFIVAYWVLEA